LLIIDFIKQKYKAWRTRQLVTSILANNQAVFRDFGRDIYMSDVVNNCIDRIAAEISKISVKSVWQEGNRTRVAEDEVTQLFRCKPNPLQTSKDFLSCCEWLRRKDCHCFIYPEYELAGGGRHYTAFWPLNPQSVTLGQDRDGVWLIKFRWFDGNEDTLPYSDVIHLKWRRGKNVLLGGGDDNGKPDMRDTLKAVQELDKTLQGLGVAIETRSKLSGILTAKTVLAGDALQKKADDFADRLSKNPAGVVALDIAADFQPMNLNTPVIPKETMKFLKDIIRERYGVSDAIISGDYTDEQHAAFFETCLEDFIEEFQQAFTAAIFSPQERENGRMVKCYYNKVEYFSTANKIQLATIARDTGLMTLNQIAEMFGLEPFAGGDRRLQSLNYVNVDLVDSYQVQQKGANDGQSES